jgi:hypothetical protein
LVAPASGGQRAFLPKVAAKLLAASYTSFPGLEIGFAVSIVGVSAPTRSLASAPT